MSNTLAHETVDDVPQIAAFAPEIVVLNVGSSEPDSVSINGITFTTGVLEEQNVVLFLSGITMAKAVMSTQIALDHFNVTHSVFPGITGGVDPALNIGDIVIADQWAPYLESVYTPETTDGWQTRPILVNRFSMHSFSTWKVHMLPIRTPRRSLRFAALQTWQVVETERIR